MMVSRGAENGKEMGWEGRKKAVDTLQRTLGEEDVIREGILIKFSRSAFEGL